MNGVSRVAGKCKSREKAMAGAVKREIDCNSINYDSCQITEKPLGSSEIEELPLTAVVELDLYTQARKSLSFRSPFDSDETTPAPACASGRLPSSVSYLLNRHLDGRKRQKKSISSSEKKKSAPAKHRGSKIWVETEEYFRELNVEDIDRLEQVSSVGFLGTEKCFLIPSFGEGDDSCMRYDAVNRTLKSECEKKDLSLEERVELSVSGDLEVKETGLVQEENGPTSMDVDCSEGAKHELESKEESSGGNRVNCEKNVTILSGVEWLLGSRGKIYLASERPSKKRKLLGKEAGLEKLLVACPTEGLVSACHYCSHGDTGDPLNCLIKCDSCGMAVHQRCYGVLEDIKSSWSCSWCKWKKDSSLTIERPCLLCPKSGGALKPVQKRDSGSEHKESEVGFAHLFCCQWIPEVYLENTTTMEPVMNIDEVNDGRKKMICHLCKVKWGACVRCSNGACRIAFHPLCAREASHRMEIWGKLGCQEVELRAFCSRHSVDQFQKGAQNTVENSLPVRVDSFPSKLNNGVLDAEFLDNGIDHESHSAGGDVQRLADDDALNMESNEKVHSNGGGSANSNGGLNFSILKKLIDLGKVEAKDVALELGVSLDSLKSMLDDNHTFPEVQYKLLKWWKNHAHVGSLQKTLKVRIRSPAVPISGLDASAVSITPSDTPDGIPPPNSNVGIGNDENMCPSSDMIHGGTTEGVNVGGDGDLNGVCKEPLPGVTEEMLIDTEQHNNTAARDSLGIEENGPIQESIGSEKMTIQSHIQPNGKYVHPFVYSRLARPNSSALQNADPNHSAGVRKDPQLEASTSSGLCCHNNHNLGASSGNLMSECEEVNLDKPVMHRDVCMLKLSPADEVEGELVYYQHRILCNALARKNITNDLISKVARSLPWEIDATGKQKWDAVVVSQYNHELREEKKQGRKERRHKEAQAVLAAATAAAAASSRLSTTRKDSLEESVNQEDIIKTDVSNTRLGVYSQLNPRVRNTISRSTVARPLLDGNSDIHRKPSKITKERPRTCEICIRSETILNPVLVCSSCKIAVHLDCYRSVKSTTGPWYCELCDDLFSSQGSGASATTSWERPYFVAECGLCGGTASAFRKTVDGQWIHALCAEWLLESTYRRGQVDPIEGLETASKGNDSCIVCHRKQGACLKCSHGHCTITFHPTCGRSAGLYMITKMSGGKLQHKAYCEKHSVEQRAKANTQKHGIEEFKSLKQVRVELERLRLLCERIVKREKLKRELVLCSHDILASNRDSVLSALARHPFYQPEISSEVSIKGYADGYKSGNEILQRSDDLKVDTTVAGKRRVKLPISMGTNEPKTPEISTSQNLYMLKPIERIPFSGKQITRPPSVLPRNILEDSRQRKHSETFEREVIMTSDQASMKNQRLPKGFVYVPIRSLSKDKNSVPSASSQEQMERKMDGH